MESYTPITNTISEPSSKYPFHISSCVYLKKDFPPCKRGEKLQPLHGLDRTNMFQRSDGSEVQIPYSFLTSSYASLFYGKSVHLRVPYSDSFHYFTSHAELTLLKVNREGWALVSDSLGMRAWVPRSFISELCKLRFEHEAISPIIKSSIRENIGELRFFGLSDFVLYYRGPDEFGNVEVKENNAEGNILSIYRAAFSLL